MGRVSEAGPEAVRQRLNHAVGRRAGVAKWHHHRDAADHGRNSRQRPDGAIGSEFFRVQQAEVLGHFAVFAHGVGYTRAGVHTRERGADQRQKHRERLA